jgi:hypothetical protein
MKPQGALQRSSAKPATAQLRGSENTTPGLGQMDLSRAQSRAHHENQPQERPGRRSSQPNGR